MLQEARAFSTVLVALIDICIKGRPKYWTTSCIDLNNPPEMHFRLFYALKLEDKADLMVAFKGFGDGEVNDEPHIRLVDACREVRDH